MHNHKEWSQKRRNLIFPLHSHSVCPQQPPDLFISPHLMTPKRFIIFWRKKNTDLKVCFPSYIQPLRLLKSSVRICTLLSQFSIIISLIPFSMILLIISFLMTLFNFRGQYQLIPFRWHHKLINFWRHYWLFHFRWQYQLIPFRWQHYLDGIFKLPWKCF